MRRLLWGLGVIAVLAVPVSLYEARQASAQRTYKTGLLIDTMLVIPLYLLWWCGVWALDQSHGTSDDTPWFEREFGVLPGDMSRYVANSPHLHAENIRTPMLVIHGERDYRVPIGEALRLYTTLQLQGVPSQFLYFPDENHWVLKPRNSRLWYETVLAFLDHHVLGREWTRPELL